MENNNAALQKKLSNYREGKAIENARKSVEDPRVRNERARARAKMLGQYNPILNIPKSEEPKKGGKRKTRKASKKNKRKTRNRR